MILPTRRALLSAATVSLLGLLGLRVPGALDAMLFADLALVIGVWLGATRAIRPGWRDLTVEREAPPAFSVGLTGEVGLRWSIARAPSWLRARGSAPIARRLQPPRTLGRGDEFRAVRSNRCGVA